MRENDKSVEVAAASGKGKGKENGVAAGSAGSEGMAIENGHIVATERPPLETFVTATDELPTRSRE
jgi:hypothetical protein